MKLQFAMLIDDRVTLGGEQAMTPLPTNGERDFSCVPTKHCLCNRNDVVLGHVMRTDKQATPTLSAAVEYCTAGEMYMIPCCIAFESNTLTSSIGMSVVATFIVYQNIKRLQVMDNLFDEKDPRERL